MKVLISAIKGQSLTLIIFVILCFKFLFDGLTGGEYQYFSLAKQFVDSTWISDSFSVTEFAGTRIIYQIIVGLLLKFISFESASFILKILVFTLFSLILSTIFKKLNISNVLAIIIFSIYVWGKQAFFGYEWIFGGIEPKTFAYLFAFYAINSFLNEKYRLTYFFIFLSTLFHLMVGGWLFVACSIYMIFKKQLKLAIKDMLYFIVPLIPFVAYLYIGLYRYDSFNIESNHNLNWVYVYFRLKHHLGIFHETEHFMAKQLPGIIYSVLFLFLLFYLRKQFKSKEENKILALFYIIILENLLFVLVAATDKFIFNESGGLFLKYYPFRLSSLAMFFAIVLSSKLINEKTINFKYHRVVISTMIIISVFSVLNSSYISINKKRKDKTEWSDYKDVTEYIKKNIDRKKIFYLHGMEFQGYESYSFIYLSEHENMFVAKFTPAENIKLNEWYSRFLAIEKLKEDFMGIEEFTKKYNIDYVLSGAELNELKTRAIYSNQKYHIYAMQDGIKQ